MNGSSGEILFLREPPRGLLTPAGGGGRFGAARFSTVFDRNGFRGKAGEGSITCFWIGMGRRVRAPGRQLLERIRQGEITDIVDIGCAGALDPALRRGDLVLSSDDLTFDSAVPLAVHLRAEPGSLFQEAATIRGVSLRVAPILTHERFIAGRDERIRLCERTGCAAVQMEHAWFLQLLQSLLGDCLFDKIRIAHLVLITDAVPRSSGRTAAVRSAWDALTGYAFPCGSGGVMSLRKEVLSRWLSV